MRKNLFVTILSAAGFVVLFIFLWPCLGNIVSVFAVIPVGLSGWYFGIRVGGIAGILSIVLCGLLMYISGEPEWVVILYKDGILGFIFILLVGLIIGWLSNMKKKLKGELEKRLEAEEKLESLIKKLEFKNRELEQFTETVSHDLKSPLITIKGFISYIEAALTKGNYGSLRSDLLRISNSVTRMEVLIFRLLELSRVGSQPLNYEEVSTGVVIREVLELFRDEISKRKVTVRLDKYFPELYVDRTYIGQIYQNLVQNSLNYIGDQDNPVIEIGCKKDSNDPVFFVKDNGMGILPSDRERIFNFFERLNTGINGSGLGLAIVRKIVEAHNGIVWVESDGINQGSTFFFTLPIGTGGDR